MRDKLNEALTEWRRFAMLTPGMDAQLRLQFLLTMLGDAKLKEVNDLIERQFHETNMT